MNTTFHDDDSYFELNEYDYFGEFLINKFVKGYWTALFVLCLYWGFFWFVRHIFGYNDTSRFQNSRREETVIDAISGVGNNRSYHHQDSWVNHSTAMGISTRLSRASEMLSNLVLLLLSMLTLNTMARGGTRSVMVLSWIFVGLAIFWSLFELVYEHHIARLVYSIAFYGIIITIGSIAFQNGFDQYD